ncbi:MAG: DUF1896 family protein [Rikenellaceae bacterium]
MLLKNQIEFSYFSLQLLEYLIKNHPLRAKDYDFIKLRGDEAAEEFELSLANGYSQQQAIDNAAEILFKGVHFSIYSLIKDILWEEFAETIPAERVEECALRLLPRFDIIYDPTDEGGVEDVDDLKTEQVRSVLLPAIKKMIAEGYGI